MANPYKCGACGKKFRSLSTFTAHRVGKYKDEHPDYGRSCRTAEDLAARGWTLRKGVWFGPAAAGRPWQGPRARLD